MSNWMPCLIVSKEAPITIGHPVVDEYLELVRAPSRVPALRPGPGSPLWSRRPAPVPRAVPGFGPRPAALAGWSPPSRPRCPSSVPVFVFGGSPLLARSRPVLSLPNSLRGL